MKITDVKVYVIDALTATAGARPEAAQASGEMREWTYVQIDTDEGLTGFGEASNYPGNGSFIVAKDNGSLANTFASSYSKLDWYDYCANNADQASLVRLLFREP